MEKVRVISQEKGMYKIMTSIGEMLAELSLKCRFFNCTHTSEPGCAIRDAISNGVISEERYNSYLKLKNENLYLEDSESYLKAKEEKFKNIAKQIRSMKK